MLPHRQLDVLRSISAFLRHRDLVLCEWGYDRTVARTQGLNVLFAGESGTGKTMAAQVLAHDLGLDLYRIDLASTVSKYIGETEKNLDRIFAAAEGSNAILFFDEADALFGKRSEVRDSHDRYANIEVAYLLQRMDSYPGAVILATNFRQNMDDAFLRRLDFVVDFPFPEADDRERIWRLVLPEPGAGRRRRRPRLPRQPVQAGRRQHPQRLAGRGVRRRRGGQRRSAMRHLIRAVALEYTKLGRLTLESDFERFHERSSGGKLHELSPVGSLPATGSPFGTRPTAGRILSGSDAVITTTVPLNTMLADLDEALRALLRRELAEHGFEGVEVVFDAPTKEWSASLSAPTVNLFLYDLREVGRPPPGRVGVAAPERPHARGAPAAAAWTPPSP